MQSFFPRLARAALIASLAASSAAALAGCEPSCPAEHPEACLPDKAQSWFVRAKKGFVEGDFEDAHEAIGSALTVAPNEPVIRILAAHIALARLEYAEVLTLLKGMPGTEAASLRGRALWYKGEIDAAAEDLGIVLADPQVKDEWAKAASKLAHFGAGRTPFTLSGGLLASVEMIHVSPVAPYFIVPVEIDGEAGLAMIATGMAEVVLDSATRPEPSWTSLRFGERFEVRDVPAVTQDLSGISKELGAPIKALLGVNLLRHLNATIDFRGRQFVVRSYAPPPPPSATRVPLHYVKGGGLVVQAALGGEKGPKAALVVDSMRPFPLAMDEAGWKKGGVEMGDLKALAGDPDHKLKEGRIDVFRLGAFDVPKVSGLYGIPMTELEKAMNVDVDGILGAGLLFAFRLTFSDGGRVLWLEDDTAMERMMSQPGPVGPVNQALPPPSGPILPGPVGPAPGPAAPEPPAKPKLPPKPSKK